MADILVYSDKPGVALELASKGRELATALDMRVSAAALGEGASEQAEGLGVHGAERVYVSESEAFVGYPADVVAEALAQIAWESGATRVILGSTRRGKDVAPRLAQKLGAGCVTDVSDLAVEDGAWVASRYAFGGATVAKETATTEMQVFAVMPKTFEADDSQPGAGEVVTPALSLEPSAVRLVDRRPREGEVVNLAEAERIVGLGRGFQAREDVAAGEKLAYALEAELACTKGLADFQWMAEERVIGLSGAKTSPDVYIALGISGQIQHVVGVMGAKIIVAVNTDKDAPIFKLADYGIVGDLYEVIPALLEKIG